ncbi:MAG: glycerophosphodiester phosphodiesterase [Parcubacteria group bacterium]|jgi:glycerophosphoryl diester phosphodiesterase
MKEKLIIAHRGDTSSSIENTIESFENAIRKGADMIEFDVRRTKDGVFIVHHSQKICRKLIRTIGWEEIEKINKRRSAAVPKLEEVLRMARGRVRLDIEIKESGHEAEIMEMVLRHVDYKDFVVTSFNDPSIKKLKERYPKATAGLIFSIRKSKGKFSELLTGRRRSLNAADFFVSSSSLMRLGFRERAKKYGKRFMVWGVNGRRMMKKMLEDSRVEGIITDKLDVALEVKKELIGK